MDQRQKFLNQFIDDVMNEVAFKNNVFPREAIQKSVINIVADVEPESIRVIRRHHDQEEKNDQRYVYVHEG